MPLSYVTYDIDGALTGAYLQDLLPEHTGAYIQVSGAVRREWVNYRANSARDGVEPFQPAAVVPDLLALKAAKREQVNDWRAEANLSSFPFAGKQIACDPLSRSDIDGVANSITLSGGFPTGFPMAWKATDNSYVLLPDIDAFKAMHAAMTAQGMSNFKHSQVLKAQIDAATTPEQVATISW